MKQRRILTKMNSVYKPKLEVYDGATDDSKLSVVYLNKRYSDLKSLYMFIHNDINDFCENNRVSLFRIKGYSHVEIDES